MGEAAWGTHLRGSEPRHGSWEGTTGCAATCWSHTVGESTESSPAGTCLALLLFPSCFSPLACCSGASDRLPNALRWLRGSRCLGGAPCRGAHPELIASDTALASCSPTEPSPVLMQKAQRVKCSPRGRQQELGFGVLEVKLLANGSRCVPAPAHRRSQGFRFFFPTLGRAEKERG